MLWTCSTQVYGVQKNNDLNLKSLLLPIFGCEICTLISDTKRQINVFGIKCRQSWSVTGMTVSNQQLFCETE